MEWCTVGRCIVGRCTVGRPRCTEVGVNLTGSCLAVRILLPSMQKSLRTNERTPSLEELVDNPCLGTVVHKQATAMLF